MAVAGSGVECSADGIASWRREGGAPEGDRLRLGFSDYRKVKAIGECSLVRTADIKALTCRTKWTDVRVW